MTSIPLRLAPGSRVRPRSPLRAVGSHGVLLVVLAACGSSGSPGGGVSGAPSLDARPRASATATSAPTAVSGEASASNSAATPTAAPSGGDAGGMGGAGGNASGSDANVGGTAPTGATTPTAPVSNRGGAPNANAGQAGADQGMGGAQSAGDPGGAAPVASAGGSEATAGSGGAGGQAPVEIDPDALYAAPDGRAGAAGTIDDPTTLPDALSRARGGGTIYVRGGTYPFGSTLDLNGNGSEGAPIVLSAYPLDEERPRLDFSSMSENSSNRGLSLSGNYWHLWGIDVFAAGDNCMFVSGSNNTVEFMTFSECADTGLQLGSGASDNLILNCDSFFNADSTLENADGFAAKLDVGSGNKFKGCRSWNNLDDGWDGYLRGADNVTTTYEDCWAIDNGKLKNGSVGAGDGNGFKTGGSDGKDLQHNASYTRCIAAGNVHDGFDHNSNRGSITIVNCAAHDNGANINFSTTNIARSLTVENTISIGTRGEQSATMTDISNNSWQDGRDATAGDFVSIDIESLKAARKPDGSLPDVDYLKLVADSDLRDAGVDLGLPYNGSAPDIGPFESDP